MLSEDLCCSNLLWATQKLAWAASLGMSVGPCSCSGVMGYFPFSEGLTVLRIFTSDPPRTRSHYNVPFLYEFHTTPEPFMFLRSSVNEATLLTCNNPYRLEVDSGGPQR